MIYKQFEQADIVAGRLVKVSSGFFADGSTTINQKLLNSSSLQATVSGSNRFDAYNGYYYLDVYPNSTTTSSAENLFSITYGNVSASVTGYDEYNNIQLRQTKAIFTQYVNELNNGENFAVKSQVTGGAVVVSTLSTDFVALTFNSQKVKDQIDPGQFQITLASTGSSGDIICKLIDDSTVVSQSGSAAYYNLILGNYDSTTGQPKYWDTVDVTTGRIDPADTGYSSNTFVRYFDLPIGLIYPKAGVIILNVEFLRRIGAISNAAYSVRTTAPSSTTSTPDIKQEVYRSLVWADGIVNISYPQYLRVRRSEFVPSRHYFVRVKNRDFNYTNNPTFTYQSSGTDPVTGDFTQRGDIRQTEFLTDPKVYPTSVGLYNSNNELVAVAKLSRPAQKTFSNELLIKVRLDF
jgi:hypothetical protein